MFDKKRQEDDLGRCEIGKIDDKRNDCTFDDLFESDWEVFVIKPDKSTGKLVGRTVCCAQAVV